MQEELKMRMLHKVMAGAAVAAAALTLAGGLAFADPHAEVTPSAGSVVGVGSNTSEYLLDQLSLKYDTANPHKTQIYSLDACQVTGCTSAADVVIKEGCKPIPRADISGSSAGISELALNTPDRKGHFCIDFARSSRDPRATDPGGIAFVILALDNVTYASLAKGSNVPGNLSIGQLHAIYTCDVTRKGYKPNTWGALLGTKAKKGTRNVAIAPYLPATGSDSTLFSFGRPKCVTESATLQENEGIDPIFTGKNAPNILIPFSAGRWIAQAYHSAACAKKGCPTVKNQGVFIQCKTPAKGQNLFGCDINGPLRLNDIDGVSAITGRGAKTVLNPNFTFPVTLFVVVRGTFSIPTYLATFFGRRGAFCSAAYASVIRAYGFSPAPTCGEILVNSPARSRPGNHRVQCINSAFRRVSVGYS
jgi:hypothetical protein